MLGGRCSRTPKSSTRDLGLRLCRVAGAQRCKRSMRGWTFETADVSAFSALGPKARCAGGLKGSKGLSLEVDETYKSEVIEMPEQVRRRLPRDAAKPMAEY